MCVCVCLFVCMNVDLCVYLHGVVVVCLCLVVARWCAWLVVLLCACVLD